MKEKVDLEERDATKSRIVNLTLHSATEPQKEEGVFDVDVAEKKELESLLTFSVFPSKEEVKERAEQIAKIAEKNKVSSAMIGGAPYLMSSLERALLKRGVTPLYAFSKRESIEKMENGEVIKTSVFKHLGFVEPGLVGLIKTTTPPE